LFLLLRAHGWVTLAHPRLGLDVTKPVGYRRDFPTAVFLDMLLADVTNVDVLPVRVRDAVTEHTLSLEDPLAVVP
jgi:hypothetical protein